MDGGVLVVTTRAALAFYLIKRLNLDLDSNRIAPERKQIFLSNLAEVEDKLRSANAEMRARVACAGSQREQVPASHDRGPTVI